MATTDGLSESEKVNILFKNYMNFPSMKSAVSFDSENNQTFSTNIFGSSVMSDVPPTLPAMGDIANDSTGHQDVVDLLTSNSSGLNIDTSWVSTKLTTSGAKFRKDTSSGANDSILRFERLKLDYAGGNTAAFICKDNDGNNILRNLIPNSYSTDIGYTLSLEYEDDADTTIGDAYWLQKRQTTLGDGGIDKQWGAPLFDAKNGIITFYDVADMDDPQSIFDPAINTTTAPTFYLTATKYVGAFGVGSNTGTTVSGGVWDQDAGTLDISYGEGNVIIEKNLDVNGELDVSAATVQNRLDVMGDVSLNGRVDISGSFYVNGVEISGNSVGGGGSWDETGNNTTTGDLSVGGNLAVTGNITLNSNDIATEFYVNNEISKISTSGGSSSGGGGTVSIEAYTLGISTILASDPLDLSAEYKSHHKSNQPPAFEYHNSSQEEAVTSQSSSITVQWEDFAKKFIDAFTGRAFPLSFQTYVDISYTNFGTGSDSDISNTDGWKTIFIGKGTYDGSGARVNPDLSFVIPNNATSTVYTDNTGGLGIPFTGKVTQDDTFAIPPFTQSDTFDLRVYPVNQSQETPNYLIYTGISLKSTNKPGPVTIINFDALTFATGSHDSIQMDFSFNLDVSDSTASGIPMKSYDISYNQVATRSLFSGYTMHSASPININVESDASPKDDIAITGLYPGAQYEIQVRAQNSLATGLPFGDYGDPTNSDFTQVATDRYITTSDLTNPSNTLAIALENGTTEIPFYISGTQYPSTPVANTTSGYIDITGQAEFYVNYGKQGKSLTEAATNTTLVNAKIYSVKDNVEDSSITFAYRTNGAAMYDGLPLPNNIATSSEVDSIFDDDGGSNNYTFEQATAYTERASVNKNKGFVYSSTLGLDSASQSLTNPNKIAMFANSFPTDSLYSANYEISGTQLNHSAPSEITGGSGTFVVDDYTGTPQFAGASIDTLTPTITTTSPNTLCGIPSVSSLQISLACPSISNFKGYITPYVSNNHSIFTVTSNSAGFTGGQAKSGSAASNISSYSPTYTQTKTYPSQTYIAAGSFNINVDVYYLGRDSSNKPERKTISAGANGANASYGKIFRDSNFSPPSNMFTLTNSGGFAATPYSASNQINATQLIYFDGKIVGSLYQNSHGVGPFQNWGDSTWAVNGPNYNHGGSGLTFTKNDGSTSGTYKWIVFNVTTTLANDQQLSNFQFVKDGVAASQITANDNPNRLNNDFASFMIYYDGTSNYNFGNMEANYSTGNSGNQWYDAGASVGPSPNMSAASGKNGVWHPVENNIKMNSVKPSGEQYYLAIGINTSATGNSHVIF
tara:strand:- start:1290 stop:5216 length:3927 start_codon:yes stop_codon:yes gene_type:complete